MRGAERAGAAGARRARTAGREGALARSTHRRGGHRLDRGRRLAARPRGHGQEDCLAAPLAGRAREGDRAAAADDPDVRARVGDPPFAVGIGCRRSSRPSAPSTCWARRATVARGAWREIHDETPEVIVFMPAATTSRRPRRRASSCSTTTTSPTPAAREGNIFAVDATSFFSRPGPRIVDGLEILAWAAHPEAYPEPRRAVSRASVADLRGQQVHERRTRPVRSPPRMQTNLVTPEDLGGRVSFQFELPNGFQSEVVGLLERWDAEAQTYFDPQEGRRGRPRAGPWRAVRQGRARPAS